jgi:hypothetical protein
VATPSVVADPKARRALRSAFVTLARGNSGRYEVEIPLGDRRTIREYGSYQLRPIAFETTRVYSGPGQNLAIALVGVGDDRWIRLTSVTVDDRPPKTWPCWVNYDDLAAAATPPDFPIDLAAGPSGQPPLAMVAASWGTGLQLGSSDSIRGTTDLTLALSMLGAKVVAAAGIDTQAETTVPASFFLHGGTLSGFAVRLDALPTAVEAAGGANHPAIQAMAGMQGSIDVRFSKVGAPVQVQAPPEDERVKLAGTVDFETAMRSCGRD